MNKWYAWMSGSAVLTLAVALLVTTMTAPTGWAQQGDGATIKVGTYNPQQVFDRYPDREAMMNQMQELQGQMQDASQQGDQQQMAQLQQQMQQAQNEAIQKFQRDVEEAVPAVAQEREIDLVVTEVVYQADRVEAEDITDDVIEQLGGEPAPQQQPMLPQQGQGQGSQGQGQQGEGQQPQQ